MEDVKKKFWLHGAISALSHAASIKNIEEAKCIDEWYFNDKIAEKNGLIIASMEQYPEHAPSTILLALIELDCDVYWEATN